MLFGKIILPMAAGMILCACVSTKKAAPGKSINSSISSVSPKMDTVRNDTTKKSNKLLPYEKVITEKAVTSRGLILVHKVDEKYYFEIQDSLLNKDILVVNRISKSAAEVRPVRGMIGYAGDEIGRNIIELTKGPSKNVFIRRRSFIERSFDSTENGLFKSVSNSSLQPIVAAFDIKAITPDSTGFVLDITDYINSDNDIFLFDGSAKANFKLGVVQKDKSYIESITAFPINVEIKTLKTYGAGDAATTFELNSSIILLPKQQMQPRFFDGRVGYFATFFRNFDKNPQRVDYTEMINRWRLEPREEDIDKYKEGILVEPKKPIVFYIDPATPKKWIPYLIQGVNDWQKAFEKAGFKNAIHARLAPTKEEDSTWSLEDVRYSVIVYKPSVTPNASGPHINDPRTGEILESHINWYHNVMQLLHDWYMIQAGPNDPKARKMQFDDALMGQLIRFVSSHEVGHTLGLRHNFGASSTVPVEKLRDKKWVEENGFCPSIMDYARFNYVAQPEDCISEKGIFPRIGVYDEWAIEWGYRWLPHLVTEQEQKPYMNKWISETVAKDNRLWFGSETSADPRCQSEDLGDNAVKAGEYGIKNLKRVMQNVVHWTNEPGEDYDNLRRMQTAISDQFKRYINHAASNLASNKYDDKRYGESGAVYTFPTKSQQKEMIRFIDEQLFTTPEWLMSKDVFVLTGTGTIYSLIELQKQILPKIISNSTFGRLAFARFNDPNETYSINELLIDVDSRVMKEIKTRKPIDEYRRNLQKQYILQLISIVQPDPQTEGNDFSEKNFFTWNKWTDVPSVVNAHMRRVLKEIQSALPGYKDADSRMHLMDLKERLKKALEPGKQQQQINNQPGNNAFTEFPYELRAEKTYTDQNCKGCSMWRRGLSD